MRLRFLLLSMAFITTANSAEWPKPQVGNCEFYQKLESQLHCKDSGVNYLSHYAPYYCEAFMTQSKTWKQPLKKWANKTGSCLQDLLYEHRGNPEFSCATLERFAFKTHTACYDAAELCQLSLGEMTEVLKVIRIKDLLKEFRYSYKEITKIGRACISKWILE